MRKIVSIALVMLCVAPFLALAAGQKDNTPVKLEYWTVYEKDSALNKIFEAAAANVKASNNIDVTIVNKGDAGFRELLTASAMSQSGPDIVFNWTGMADIVTGGRQGLHYPLNKDNLFTKDELSNLLLLDSCTDPTTGDVYGTAYGNNYIAVAYNKTMMEQAGIDWKSFPPKWTYDEFLAVCKKLKAAGITPFGYANKEGIFADWWHSFSFPSYVDKISDVIPYYSKKPIYNDVFGDFCKNWKGFYDAGYYLDGGNTISINDLWGQFTAKKCAIIPLFPALYSIYVKALGEDTVGIMEWPSMGGHGKLAMANPIYGDAIGITKWTKHPKEAALYLKQLVFNKDIVTQFVAAGLFPVDKRMKLSDFNMPGAELKRFAAVHQTLPTYPEGHAFWTREYSSVTEKFCNSMILGQITPQQYAAEIEAVLK
jgi:ABC-type glycerol-3-phosphate transport system substrate-binding protein